MNIPDQSRIPILEALSRYTQGNPAYFRIPGHRGPRGINARFRAFAGDGIFSLDRTETPLLDDLHSPREAIREAQELAADLFGADRTWFSVNGTSAGIQAMMLACASPGEKIILPRNAHRSCLSGLILGDIRPVYVRPGFITDWEIPGGLRAGDVRQALAEHPDTKAVLAVSPTYHGLTSDLAGIAEACHEARVPLLVDEAHGAHFYFSDALPAGALASGADACAQSTHKVLGALTQASMVHVRGSRVSAERLSAAMKILQTTSPSYLLMASLDCARQDMALHGGEWTDRALNLAAVLCRGMDDIPGIRYLKAALKDPARITIDVSGLGLTGFGAKKALFEEHGVDMELADLSSVTGIITGANTKEDIERLLSALRSLASRAPVPPGGRTAVQARPAEPPQAPAVLMPRQAFFADAKAIPWEQSRGRIAAETIALYPPGIPVVYPGEIITPEVWEYVDNNRQAGCRIQGPSDTMLDTVRVID